MTQHQMARQISNRVGTGSIAPHPAQSDIVPALAKSLDAVEAWIERHAYKGYDPGDGLTSWLRPLTLNNLFAERVLQQIIWKSPINLRPMLGVRPLESTKGRGFMAWSYLFRAKTDGSDTARSKAIACLDWLSTHTSSTQHGIAWGNHFDFSTRGGRMPAHAPSLVWTSLIGQAYLEAFEQQLGDRFLQKAVQICEWILSLPRSNGCISYVEYEQSSIHNSNMLGAAMLARTWSHTHVPIYRQVARAAMKYSCDHQRHDGSWFYGEETKYHWVDNFHTGYNLDSLKRYVDAIGDGEFDGALARGYLYFRDTFFDREGRPHYYNDRHYPIDIQCAAQAIDTFALFADYDSDRPATCIRHRRGHDQGDAGPQRIFPLPAVSPV